jgi:hypothetical protein
MGCDAVNGNNRCSNGMKDWKLWQRLTVWFIVAPLIGIIVLAFYVQVFNLSSVNSISRVSIHPLHLFDCYCYLLQNKSIQLTD